VDEVSASGLSLKDLSASEFSRSVHVYTSRLEKAHLCIIAGTIGRWVRQPLTFSRLSTLLDESIEMAPGERHTWLAALGRPVRVHLSAHGRAGGAAPRRCGSSCRKRTRALSAGGRDACGRAPVAWRTVSEAFVNLAIDDKRDCSSQHHSHPRAIRLPPPDVALSAAPRPAHALGRRAADHPKSWCRTVRRASQASMAH